MTHTYINNHMISYITFTRQAEIYMFNIIIPKQKYGIGEVVADLEIVDIGEWVTAYVEHFELIEAAHVYMSYKIVSQVEG